MSLSKIMMVNEMPYITKSSRKEYVPVLDVLEERLEKSQNLTPDVTFCIYHILVSMYGVGRWEKRADAMKVLSCVEHEFYRCYIAPYEDTKILENGNVLERNEEGGEK
jgi:hypothetical protein